jgi:HNH endonuclease
MSHNNSTQQPTNKTIEEFLKERCVYDKETGKITWASNRGKAKKGCSAEYMCTNGYKGLAISFNGRRHRFLSHRVIFVLVTGDWPSGVVDHIDNIKDNNKWQNLRDCSQSDNTTHRVMKKRYLPLGVVYAGHANSKNPYVAYYKNNSLGYFKTPELASKAYEQAYLAEYGEDWRQL